MKSSDRISMASLVFRSYSENQDETDDLLLLINDEQQEDLVFTILDSCSEKLLSSIVNGPLLASADAQAWREHDELIRHIAENKNCSDEMLLDMFLILQQAKVSPYSFMKHLANRIHKIKSERVLRELSAYPECFSCLVKNSSVPYEKKKEIALQAVALFQQHKLDITALAMIIKAYPSIIPQKELIDILCGSLDLTREVLHWSAKLKESVVVAVWKKFGAKIVDAILFLAPSLIIEQAWKFLAKKELKPAVAEFLAGYKNTPTHILHTLVKTRMSHYQMVMYSLHNRNCDQDLARTILLQVATNKNVMSYSNIKRFTDLLGKKEYDKISKTLSAAKFLAQNS